ncbi:MAG TPA: N-acetylmuramoyl-L-alanine amidase [bacterium]|nr:N-acetylmuramoyl-L-alanine amidase [bacterium]
MKRIFPFLAAAGIVFGAFVGAAAGAVEKPLYHVVERSETLWQIARKYGVPVAQIRQSNGLRMPYRLSVGQRLRIPGRTVEVQETVLAPDDDYTEIEQLCKIYTRRRVRWMYIVVHHSGSDSGNALIFDRYHRYKRHMENGLAYHFVIDSGLGGPDGRIEVGRRWKAQLEGGHTSSKIMNKVGIGICLVGNYQKYVPTKRQLRSLCKLVRYLQRMNSIPSRNVILHRQVIQRHTECPGKKFPVETFKRMLRETA